MGHRDLVTQRSTLNHKSFGGMVHFKILSWFTGYTVMHSRCFFSKQSLGFSSRMVLGKSLFMYTENTSACNPRWQLTWIWFITAVWLWNTQCSQVKYNQFAHQAPSHYVSQCWPHNTISTHKKDIHIHIYSSKMIGHIGNCANFLVESHVHLIIMKN